MAVPGYIAFTTVLEQSRPSIYVGLICSLLFVAWQIMSLIVLVAAKVSNSYHCNPFDNNYVLMNIFLWAELIMILPPLLTLGVSFYLLRPMYVKRLTHDHFYLILVIRQILLDINFLRHNTGRQSCYCFCLRVRCPYLVHAGVHHGLGMGDHVRKKESTKGRASAKAPQGRKAEEGQTTKVAKSGPTAISIFPITT